MIDVIIPTYRPDLKFDLLLNRLQKQSVLPRCIYILNTEVAPDYTSERMEQRLEKIFPMEKRQVKFQFVSVSKSEFDHGGTRKAGAGLSDADYLLFMTQDAIPEDVFLLERLYRACSEKGVAASYARQLPHKHASKTEKYSRAYNYPFISCTKSLEDLKVYGIKTYFCSNVCAMYRGAVYRKLGGFVDKTIFNEDMIFAYKLIHEGYMVAYEAEAKVIHSHSYSWMQQFRRNFDVGVSQAQFKEVFSRVSSESEGLGYVKEILNYLYKKGSYLDIADFLIECGFKYAGYLLGKKYRWIPRCAVLFCSMNQSYWNIHTG